MEWCKGVGLGAKGNFLGELRGEKFCENSMIRHFVNHIVQHMQISPIMRYQVVSVLSFTFTYWLAKKHYFNHRKRIVPDAWEKCFITSWSLFLRLIWMCRSRWIARIIHGLTRLSSSDFHINKIYSHKKYMCTCTYLHILKRSFWGPCGK